MNTLLRNMLRSTHLFRSAPGSAYSTVANVAESPIEEQDKLFKTIEIEMRANERSNMASYSKFAQMAAEHLGISIGKCYAVLPPNYLRDKLCLLRSGYVNKKCRIQYEVRTYYRYMNFHYLTGSTADTFLEYIERNLPEGIALKITKVELRKLPDEILQPVNGQEAKEEAPSNSPSSK